MSCPPPGVLPDPGTELLSLIATCIGKQVLYHQHLLGRPVVVWNNINFNLISGDPFFFLSHDGFDFIF